MNENSITLTHIINVNRIIYNFNYYKPFENYLDERRKRTFTSPKTALNSLIADLDKYRYLLVHGEENIQHIQYESLNIACSLNK